MILERAKWNSIRLGTRYKRRRLLDWCDSRKFKRGVPEPRLKTGEPKTLLALAAERMASQLLFERNKGFTALVMKCPAANEILEWIEFGIWRREQQPEKLNDLLLGARNTHVVCDYGAL
jgi:hypothetical protein